MRLAVLALAAGVGAGLWRVPAVRAEGSSESFQPSGSVYGGVGLVQSRNARFREDGTLEAGFSTTGPHQRFFINFQALPWLEATGRYTITDVVEEVTNRRDFHDRSFDLKLRLWEEGKYLPQFAVGLQDILGTGRFASEYLVASKRYYDFDFTLGLAWGGRIQRDFPNPFGGRRSNDFGEGGTLALSNWFRGRNTALFGGIEYHTPIDGLTLKLDITGENIDRLQPANTNDSGFAGRINYGLSYRPFPWLDVSLGAVRGKDFMLRVSTLLNPSKVTPVPKIDVPPQAVQARPWQPARPENVVVIPSSETAPPGSFGAGTDRNPARQERLDAAARRGKPAHGTQEQWTAASPGALADVSEEARFGLLEAAATQRKPPVPGKIRVEPDRDEAARRFFAQMQTVELRPVAFDMSDMEAVGYIENRKYRRVSQALGRTARALANVVPPSVEKLTVVVLDNGLEISRVSLMRKDLEGAVNDRGSLEETWQHVTLEPISGQIPKTAVLNPDAFPYYTWALEPRLRQQLMDPNEPYRYAVWAALSGQVQPIRGLVFSTTLGKELFGNLDEADPTSDSQLPKVRSEIGRYLRNGDETIQTLQGAYYWNVAPDVYGRLTAGYLEMMYGGVSGEILYRPVGKRWALGLELNHAWKRDYDQKFGFLNYDVTTGHFSAYYETPWYGLIGKVHAGRYLARDLGATIELSRRFASGVEVGAWATFTNVPFSEFGEGSFDKGIFISVPLDFFLPVPSTSNGVFAINALTRDGGQRLGVSNRLYGLTRDGSAGEVINSWGGLLE